MLLCVSVVFWTGGEVLRFRPASGSRAGPADAGRLAPHDCVRVGVGDHDPQPPQGQSATPELLWVRSLLADRVGLRVPRPGPSREI